MWSYIILRDDNDQIRALWMFSFALLWLIVCTICLAIGFTTYDARLSTGSAVSPYGAVHYSPGPDNPVDLAKRVSQAQSERRE